MYDLIKGVAPRSEEWSHCIDRIHYSVELKQDPGRGKLSKGEIEKLTEVTERFRTMDDWELSEYTHEFPDWKKHHEPGASTPIPWREMLEAQGKAELVEIVERNECGRCSLVFDDRGQCLETQTISPAGRISEQVAT